MEYIACCLLCNDSVSSPLVENGHRKSKQLSEVFSTFCEYLKFDPEPSIEDEYRGRFFPFCISCSFRIYKLYDYHKEKTRILQLMSDLVTSMTSQILVNKSKDFEGEADEPGVKNLSGQVVNMRKCFLESYTRPLLAPGHEPTVDSSKEPKNRSFPRSKAPSNRTAYRTATAKATDLTSSLQIPDQEPTSVSPKKPDKISSKNANKAIGKSAEYKAELRKVKANSSFVVQVDLPESLSSGEEDPANDPLHVELQSEGNMPDFEAENSGDDIDDNSDCDQDDGEEETETKADLDEKPIIPCKNVDPQVGKYQTAIPGKYSYRGFGFRAKDGNSFKCDSCMYSIKRPVNCRRNDCFILKHIDKRHVENFGMIKIRPNEYLFASKYPGYKMPDGSFKCGVPGCPYLGDALKYLVFHLRRNHAAPRKAPKRRALDYDNLRLADIKVAPSRYSYKDFTFKLENNTFFCESCIFVCESERMVKILRHLEVHHVQKAGFTEIRSNELLFHGKFPAFRLPNGKLLCGFEGCGNVLGLPANLMRHFHVLHNNNKKCGPECLFSVKGSENSVSGNVGGDLAEDMPYILPNVEPSVLISNERPNTLPDFADLQPDTRPNILKKAPKPKPYGRRTMRFKHE